MRIVATSLKWILALCLSAIGTLIVMTFLGLSTQLMSWSILTAALGDNVFTKYQILLAWTLGAMLLAFLARIIVLFRYRNEHRLRWTEYFGQGLSSSVISGGLAYGTVIVVMAALKGLSTDIEAIGESDKEAMTNMILVAIFPTLIAMLAAFFTAHKNIVEIPKSSPPDPTFARILFSLRFLIERTKHLVIFGKERRWYSPGQDRRNREVSDDRESI